jgi:hypothetical protein
VSRGEIVVSKVRTEENLADALTKYVPSSILESYMRGIGLVIAKGRHMLSPKTDVNGVSCVFVCSVYAMREIQSDQVQSSPRLTACHPQSRAMSGSASSEMQGELAQSGSAARRSSSQNKIPSKGLKRVRRFVSCHIR